MEDSANGQFKPPDDLPGSVSVTSLINFPFAMVLADPHQEDCPIVYVNDHFTEMTGYTQAQSIGRNCRFLQGKETRPEARAAIRNAVARQDSATVDILNYRADGTPFPNRLMLTPLTDDEGKIAYYLGVQSDTSDNASLTAEARELRERLRELQHRVKNHLAMILSMIRLEARGKPPEEVVQLLTRRVQALATLYDVFSEERDGSGGTVPVGAYLTKVVNALHDLDGRPKIRMNIDMDDLQGDMDIAARLGLYLSEVVTNAMRHGLEDREEGEVRVCLTHGSEIAELTVFDSGRGMGTAVWPGTTSVGSRIVSDLTTRLDGEIIVESDGTGTRITLRFKASEATEGTT